MAQAHPSPRREGRASTLTKETTMNSALKITGALACGLLVGGGGVQLLHAQSKPPAFVVAEFANMDAVKAWRDEGAMDMENTVGSKYAAFRIYAVEGVTP